MKKKIMTLLLALGCVLSAGTATACAALLGEQGCQHQNAHYILVENEEQYLQPCIDCEDCIGFSWPEVMKSECAKQVTEPTCEDGGYTVYTKIIEGVTYTSGQLDTKPEIGHRLETVWEVKVGETLCADGGEKIERCTNAGCHDKRVLETATTGKGHLSKTWSFAKEKDKPTYLEGGILTGVCDNWNETVNDAHFSGCGETFEYKLPSLNSGNYYNKKVLSGTEVCGQPGRIQYTIEVQGQEFTFEVNLMNQNHIMLLKNGELETKAPNDEILLTPENIAKYGTEEEGLWRFFLGESSTCDSPGEAVFTCQLCGQDTPRVSPIIIVTPHTEPTDKSELQIDPTLSCDSPLKKHYTCTVCHNGVDAPMEHDYAYTLSLDQTTDTFAVEGVCANCPVKDDDSGKIIAGEYLKIQAGATGSQNPTCGSNGIIKYYYEKNGKKSNVVEYIVSNAEIGHKLNGKVIDTSIAHLYKEGLGFYIVDDGGVVPCMRGEGGVMGVFYCSECKNPIKVSLTVGHTSIDKNNDGKVNTSDGEIVQHAACEKWGTREYICKYCSNTFTVDDVAPTPYDYMYLYRGRTKIGDYIFAKKCMCGTSCSKSDWKEFTIERDKCTAIGTPSCTDYWLMQFSFVDEGRSVKTEIAFMPEHGVVIDGIFIAKPYYDNDGNVIIYKLKDEPVGGIQYLEHKEGMDACEEGSEAMGWFECACCGEWVKVRIEVEHTKPDDLAPDATEYDCILCDKKVEIDNGEAPSIE